MSCQCNSFCRVFTAPAPRCVPCQRRPTTAHLFCNLRPPPKLLSLAPNPCLPLASTARDVQTIEQLPYPLATHASNLIVDSASSFTTCKQFPVNRRRRDSAASCFTAYAPSHSALSAVPPSIFRSFHSELAEAVNSLLYSRISKSLAHFFPVTNSRSFLES